MTSCSPPSTAALPREADQRLLDGVIFGRLGAYEEPKAFYRQLVERRRSSSRSPGRTCDPATTTVCSSPGGHAPGMRQYLSSTVLAGQGGRVLGAGPAGRRDLPRRSRAGPHPRSGTGRSVIAERRTTCLPKYMERGAYYLTAWRLGRYYRTYPAYVEDEVTAALTTPSQFVRGPRSQRRGTATDDSAAFVVQDGNYLSARWPGDAYLFAERFRRLLEETSGPQVQ